MRTLRQCLLDTELARLRAIAQLWGLEPEASRRQDIAVELAAAMAEPTIIERAYAALPSEQRAALNDLLAAGGRMPIRIFTREWGEIRSMGPGRMAREEPWLYPVSTAEGLWYTGFVASMFEQDGAESYEVIFVPPEIQEPLPQPPPQEAALELEPVGEAVAVWQAGDQILDDACSLLAYLQNSPMSSADVARWPASDRSDLLKQLREKDHDRVRLLSKLIQSLEWVHPSDTGHVRPDPDVIAWLESPPSEQRRDLVSAWQDMSGWNELFQIDSLQPENTGVWRNDPTLARHALLRHLKASSRPGTWYRVEDLIKEIKRVDPDFQRPSGDYSTWYVRERGSDEYLTGFESWDAVEGMLLRHLIARPLAWFGILDLGTSQAPDDGVDCPDLYRLTPAGAAVLDLVDGSDNERPPAMRLRTDFTLQTPANRRYDRFQLSRVADWVASGDRYLYRLSPSSLQRARRQGIQVDQILSFLARVTDAPVPRFLEAALMRWEAQGTEVRLRPALLLQVASEDLMDEIIDNPITRPHIGDRLGPTASLVPRHEWRDLCSALGKLSLIPEVTVTEERHEE